MAIDTSIIIPIYNAAGMVEDSVRQIINIMPPYKTDYEILLRDDGSADGSGEVLKQVAARYPEVKYFYNTSNKGLGFTLRQLLKDAQGEKIVYCDCDLPFGADVIPALLKGLETSDIAVASRYCGALNRTPFVRRICSRLYYSLCRLLFDIPIVDIGSGSVAMRRRVLDKFDLKANGFDIHAEFYFKVSKAGFQIEEIPVKCHAARQGTFTIWFHGPQVLVKTFNLYFESVKNV